MIQFTPEQIERARQQLERLPGKLAIALARAINRAAEAARAEAIRGVTARYNVKAASVRKTITMRRANSADPRARVVSVGSAIPLIGFVVSPNKPAKRRLKTPHKAAVLKGEGLKPFPGAFVARMKNGHIGVFTRTGEQNEKTKKEKIKERYGPPIPEMMNNKDVRVSIEARATEMLNKRLDHEVNQILIQAGAK